MRILPSIAVCSIAIFTWGCSGVEDPAPEAGPMPLNRGNVKRYTSYSYDYAYSQHEVRWKVDGKLLQPEERLKNVLTSTSHVHNVVSKQMQQRMLERKKEDHKPGFSFAAFCISLDPDIVIICGQDHTMAGALPISHLIDSSHAEKINGDSFRSLPLYAGTRLPDTSGMWGGN
ncbi:MAG: hypothetical protein AAF750_09335 [Planctomycetota bacterium]